MRPTVLSIDFGSLFTKIVYVKKEAKGLNLLAYGFKKIALTPENISQAIDFIRGFLKENSISVRKAYLTISEPDCLVVKNITLPQLPKKEVLQA
ncbi:MAG: hypothetical protein NC914_01595, partial [Candidatus Omnitrophica bacterium]|nr:hypothetical protein [Candidatus Omnitrophota bacterium]